MGFGDSAQPSDAVLTQYEEMVLQGLDMIPLWNNVLASFFTWILLAGFLVLPASFSSLDSVMTSSGNLKKVLHAVRNLPLYVPFPFLWSKSN
jgi:hypothetical protein